MTTPWGAVECDIFRSNMQLGKDALLLWISARLHCAERMTDGLICKADLALLVAQTRNSPSKARKLTSELVAAGLWREVEGGWNDMEFLTNNRTREQRVREREATKARVAALRARHPVEPGADLDVTPLPTPLPTPYVPPPKEKVKEEHPPDAPSRGLQSQAIVIEKARVREKKSDSAANRRRQRRRNHTPSDDDIDPWEVEAMVLGTAPGERV